MCGLRSRRPRGRFAALISCTLLALPVPALADAIFDAYAHPVFTPAGGIQVAVVDLDGDGIDDVIGTHNDGVSWFRSLGGNEFAAPVELWHSTCLYPQVGDFDLDGRDDLLVVDADTSRVVGFYGAPGGMPEAQVVLDLDDDEKILVAGPLNGDIRADLVTHDEVGLTIRVWHASGPRIYALAQEFAAANGNLQAVLADWNLDGRPDLAITSDVEPDVRIHLATAFGTFDPPTSVTSVTNLVPLAGGLDASPGDDLLLVNLSGGVLRTSLGDGSFAAPVSHPNILGWTGLVRDFDQDGYPDVATSGPVISAQRANIGLARGLGDGTFAPTTFYTGFFSPPSLAAGDVDDDGALDLVSNRSFSGRGIFVQPGNGDGTLGVPVAPLGLSALDVDLGDLDGDLVPDAVASDADSAAVYFLRGLGDGRFASRVRLLSGPVRAARIADVNLDGYPDVVAAPLNALTVIPGGPGGAFGAPINLPTTFLGGDLHIAHMNGDGWPDVAVSQYQVNRVEIFVGGPGGFTAQGGITFPAAVTRLALGRFDADANVDLAVTHGTSVSLHAGNGAAAFAVVGVSATVPGSNSSGVVFDDLDADGTAELVVGCTGASAAASGVARIEENGSGGFSPVEFTSARIDPAEAPRIGEAVVADFDGDGDRDVMATGGIEYSVLLRNDGSGVLGAPIGFGHGWAGTGAAVADLDDDGGPDVVLATSRNSGGGIVAGALSVLLNRRVAVADAGGPDAVGARASLALAVRPNPASGDARVSFVAPSGGAASVEVFSIGGRRLATGDLGVLAAGPQSLPVPGRAGLAPGLYFVRVKVGELSQASRFVVTR